LAIQHLKIQKIQGSAWLSERFQPYLPNPAFICFTENNMGNDFVLPVLPLQRGRGLNAHVRIGVGERVKEKRDRVRRPPF
jgi:hypothetical protein